MRNSVLMVVQCKQKYILYNSKDVDLSEHVSFQLILNLMSKLSNSSVDRACENHQSLTSKECTCSFSTFHFFPLEKTGENKPYLKLTTQV